MAEDLRIYEHLTLAEREELRRLSRSVARDRAVRWAEFEKRVLPQFLPLLPPARYKGAKGGRGGAKSWFYAEMLIERCMRTPGLRAVCLREVQETIRLSVKLVLEDKIRTLGLLNVFTPRRDDILTPGGGQIVFMGMQDHTAESIKSLEGFDIGWFEEAQVCSSRSLELLRPTIRKEGSELWFSWNPRSAEDPVDQLLSGTSPPPGAVVVATNYDQNPYFPAELEKERAFDEVANPQRYAHIWLGEYEPQALGAIWSRELLHRCRVQKGPEYARVVVAVDPAVTSGNASDETGIIAVGYHNGNAYVLADWSLKGEPALWARRAIALYDLYDADCVVIETNQGGDMCRNTLRTVRPALPVKEVRASRGKHVRAEPISALYQTGRVFHVGTFPELERQLCLFTAEGYEGNGSPDRADAAIWALSELFSRIIRHRDNVVSFTVHRSHENQRKFNRR